MRPGSTSSRADRHPLILPLLRGVLAGLLSLALLMVPGAASALDADTQALEAAKRAHDRAKTELKTLLETADRATKKHRAADADHRAKWASLWEKKRTSENAVNRAIEARERDLAKLRGAITRAEIALKDAEAAAKTADETLLFFLKELQKAQAGDDAALARELEAETDRKRTALVEAQAALTAPKETLAQARAALTAREADHAATLQTLRDAVPWEEDITRLEYDHARRMEALPKIPLDEDIERARQKERETANALLSVILRNPPPHVTRVTATQDDRVWYDARFLPAPPTPPSGGGVEADPLGRTGYDAALATVTGEIETLSAFLVETERVLAFHRKRWEETSSEEGAERLAILLRERDMATFTLIAESSAVLLSAAATGGTGAPVVYGFLESLSHAAKGVKLGNVPQVYDALFRGALAGFNRQGFGALRSQAAQTLNGKYYSMLLLAGPRGEENHFGLSTKQNIIQGDVLEALFSGGASDIADLLTKSWESGALAAADLGPVALTAGVTMAKLMLQTVHETLNDESRAKIFRNALEARMAKDSYQRLLLVRDRIKVDLARLESTRQALTDLIAHGPRPQILEVLENREVPVSDLERVNRWWVTLRFSQPLGHAPELSATGAAQGIQFGRGTMGETGPTEWLFEVSSASPPKGLAVIPLLIGLSKGETPHNTLDADPRTPLRLSSLAWYDWAGQERDLDRNHALRVAPEESGNVLVLDMADQQQGRSLDCPDLARVRVGVADTKGRVILAEDAEYFDGDRGRFIAPFQAEDTLYLCVDEKGDPIRDRQGWVLIFAPDAHALDANSNGYLSPSGESALKAMGDYDRILRGLGQDQSQSQNDASDSLDMPAIPDINGLGLDPDLAPFVPSSN